MGDNDPTKPEEIALVLGNRNSDSSAGVIIGAVTATESTSTSLLNLDYPVASVLALSVWNLLFIGIVLLNQIDLIQMIAELEWLPVFAALAVIANMILLYATKTVEKLGCILLFFLFVLSFIALITLAILTQIHKGKCYSMKDSFQECSLTFWCLAVAGAINYSVGAAFLWRKPYQKSIRQLCCLSPKPSDLSPAPEVRPDPPPAPEVMSPLVPDTLFVDYTLSLVVKLTSPERITGLKVHIAYDANMNAADIADSANQNMRVEIVELTKKRSNSEFGIPEELTFVGSLELGKLLTNTSYTGRVVDDGPLAGQTFQFKTLDKNGNHRGEKRIVKLGRKWLVKGGCCCCFAHHWAVQVVDNKIDIQTVEKADFWYEVDHKETLFALPKIRINKAKNIQRRMFMPCLPCCLESNESTEDRWNSCLPWYNEPSAEMGCFDERDAGCCGGEIVGKTRMTDNEIEVFYENWSKEKRYFVATTNCIKFAYEMIEKLTDGKFSIAHSTVVAANISENSHIGGHCIKWAEGHGTIMSRRGAGDTRFSHGLFGLRCRFGPEFKAQVLAGPSGLGFFLNLSCNRVELSFGWPWIGGDVHADINLNTGFGARNGNVELHLLGFGGKVGTDGIEINTPWYGGYNVGLTTVLLPSIYLLKDSIFKV